MIVIAILATYVLTCFTWVFFRAADFSTAWEIVRAMVGLGTDVPGQTTSYVRAMLCLMVVAGMVFTHARLRKTHMEDVLKAMSPSLRGVLVALMLFSIAIVGGGQRAFIYFQF